MVHDGEGDVSGDEGREQQEKHIDFEPNQNCMGGGSGRQEKFLFSREVGVKALICKEEPNEFH